MLAAIDALELPIQLAALGSVTGMTSALLQHRRSGSTAHWPVHLAVGSLAFFGFGVLIEVLDALT